jgi:hypothetical protein
MLGLADIGDESGETGRLSSTVDPRLNHPVWLGLRLVPAFGVSRSRPHPDGCHTAAYLAARIDRFASS